MDKYLYKALNKRENLVINKINKDIKLLNNAKENDYKTVTKWYWSGTTWADMSYRMVLDSVDMDHGTDYVSDFFKHTNRYDDVYYPHNYAENLLAELNEDCNNYSGGDNIGKIKASKFALLYHLRKANPHYVVVINNRNYVHVLTKSGAISRLKKIIKDIKASTAKADKTLKATKEVTY